MLNRINKFFIKYETYFSCELGELFYCPILSNALKSTGNLTLDHRDEFI